MLERISNVSNVESPGSTLQVSYSFSCAYEFGRIFFKSIMKSLGHACCDLEGKKIKLKHGQHCILVFFNWVYFKDGGKLDILRRRKPGELDV